MKKNNVVLILFSLACVCVGLLSYAISAEDDIYVVRTYARNQSEPMSQDSMAVFQRIINNADKSVVEESADFYD